MNKRNPKQKSQSTFRSLVSVFCSVVILTINIPSARSTEVASHRISPPPASPHVKVKTGDHKLKKVVVKDMLVDSPSDIQIRFARVFEDPLIPMKGAVNATENKALSAALRSYRSTHDKEDLSALERFLSTYPKSKWAPSLKTKLAQLQFRHGYLSKALQLWTEAWQDTKKETDFDQRIIANGAIANLIILKSRLGMKDEVNKHLAEIKGRQFFGSDVEKIEGGRIGVLEMDQRPHCAYKCGPFALNTIWNLGKKEKDMNPIIANAASASDGTNLKQLKEWSDQMGLKMQIAKRSNGTKIITPAVMHWKLGHFTALIGVDKGRYHVKDPTFDTDGEMWLSQKAIDEETDGYFLVADGSLPPGWSSVPFDQASTIRGKGVSLDYNGIDTKKRAPKDCEATEGCHSCNTLTGGMAKAAVYSMLGTLNITDVPLAYHPPVGPDMSFDITYNDNQKNQPGSFGFSNLGYNWNFEWLSYLTVDTLTSIVTVRLRGGGSEVYKPTSGSYPDPDFFSQAKLVQITGGYERHLPDGSVQVFDLYSGGNYFMTKEIDPFGNSVLIQYDGAFRVSEITDAINQVTTITYVSNTFGNPGYYKMASITDPFGRHCDFSYDTVFGELISITDSVGLVSRFTYDNSGSFITSMTTPYGTTSFYKYVPGSNPNPARGLRTTYPDGTFSVLESWIGELQTTFYWDRHATSLYPNDPADQVYTHCVKTMWQDNIDTSQMQSSPQKITMPLESSPKSFKYAGTANQFYAGTSRLPIQSTRSLGGNGNLVINAKIEGTPNAGKNATVTVNFTSVSYTVQSGDSTQDVANGLAAAINADTSFRSLGITAGATKNVVSIYSESTAMASGWSCSVTSGSTFTLKINSQLRQTQVATCSGALTTGDILWFYVDNPVAIGGRRTFIHTVTSGDTLSTIVSDIASQVNADSVCQLYEVTATASGAIMYLQSFSPDVQTYAYDTSNVVKFTFSDVRNGNTDTIDYTRNSHGYITKSIDQMRRTLEYTYDSNEIDLLEVRETQQGNNFLLGHWEYNSQHLPTKYIDGSAREWDYVYNSSGQPISITDPNSNTTTMTYTGTATATIGGSVTNGDVLTLTVHDAGLSGGQKSVSHTVTGGDTLTSIATALKNSINADTDLSAIGVTASSSGAVITISSTSVNVTSYTESTSGGATETIALTANRFGYLTKIDGPMTGDQDVTTFSYDGYGRLFSQTDSEGYTLLFYYDDMNRPLKTVYPDGTFEQTIWNKLDAVLTKDRNGRWTQRSYNSMDETVFEIDPLGRKTEYVWCNCGSLSSLTDPNGNTTTWTHDLQGRPTQKIYEDSTTVTYAYQSRVNRLKSQTDALGQIKTFFYNTDGSLYQYNFSNAVHETHASTFTWDYNYPRMTSSQTNGWGEIAYTYNNYVTSATGTPITGGGMLQLVHNDVIPNSDITYEYDELGRTVNRSIDGSNNSIDWTFDAMGRVTSEQNALGTFTFAYVDNPSSASKGTTRLASITYPNSQVTKFSYFDNLGDQRLQQISNLNPSGATLSQFNYRYDPAGQITQWQQIQNNTSLNYSLDYDMAGQLVSASAADGSRSPAYLKQFYYSYDPGSNRTSVNTNSITRVRIGGTVSSGDVLTINVIDSGLSGGQKSINYTTVSGDTLSTISTKLAAAITADSDLQSVGVDAAADGAVINIRSASPNVTSYSKATTGGATETITLNVTSNFVENAVIAGSKSTGDVLTITIIDPALGGGSKDISYTVQSSDTLTTIATALKNAINADSSLQSLGVTASAVGTVITIESTSNNATTYSQSVSTSATETISLSINQNANQTIAIAGSKTTGDTVTVVVYDTGLTGGSKSKTYTVQSGDTLTSIASGIASALSADTDLQSIGLSATSTGTIITIKSKSINATDYRVTTSSGATEIAYIGLPANGIQTAVVAGTKTTGDTLTINVYDVALSGGSKSVNYVVQSGDNLASITSGIASAINADTDLQNLGVTATSSSTVLSISSTSPNLTSYSKSLSGGATETLTLGRSANVTQFGHNNVNELTSIASGGLARFEGNSNEALTSATANSQDLALKWSQQFSGNATVSSGANNVPVAITDGASNTTTQNYQIPISGTASATLTYDANGNMTSDGTNNYEWDAENRLTKIIYPGSGNKSELVYDALNRCVKITENVSGTVTSTKQHIWSVYERCEERDNTGTVSRQFLKLGEKVGTSKYFYSCDHLSSIREMTDVSGNIQCQLTYDPSGFATKLQGAMDPEFQYTGLYVHARSRLILSRSRAYDPGKGAWLSRDPIMEKGGSNLYAYVGNNPISGRDPSGFQGIFITPLVDNGSITGTSILGRFITTGSGSFVDPILGPKPHPDPGPDQEEPPPGSTGNPTYDCCKTSRCCKKNEGRCSDMCFFWYDEGRRYDDQGFLRDCLRCCERKRQDCITSPGKDVDFCSCSAQGPHKPLRCMQRQA